MTDPAVPPDDPLHDARHRLKSPLAVILARAQLLARAVRRSPVLADGERGRLLAGLAAIEDAVRVAAAQVDALRAEAPPERSRADAAAESPAPAARGRRADDGPDGDAGVVAHVRLALVDGSEDTWVAPMRLRDDAVSYAAAIHPPAGAVVLGVEPLVRPGTTALEVVVARADVPPP